jgi:3-deoxy-D-arabino-heptulosonate 7-phosphate (DAHP) synthase class II
MKCGPSLEPDALLRMLDTLNPTRTMSGPDDADHPLWP